jgi:hypothetical protein
LPALAATTPGGPLLLAQPRDPDVRAPDLERAGALEVLALEQHLAAHLVRQPAQPSIGRDAGDPLEQAPRVADLLEPDRQAQHGKASTEAVKPCRWLRPATGPSSPPAKKPATPSAASSGPDQRRVVVGRAEQVRAPAVAREQQRPTGRRVAGVAPVAGQQRAQVGVGGVRVAHLQPHGRARLHEVAHDEAAGLPVGAQDGPYQEVVVLGVLVHGDAQLQAGARERLVRRRQLGQHLLDPLQRRHAGELADDVAGRGGDGHGRTDRAAALADEGPHAAPLSSHPHGPAGRTRAAATSSRVEPRRAAGAKPPHPAARQRASVGCEEAVGREAVGSASSTATSSSSACRHPDHAAPGRRA